MEGVVMGAGSASQGQGPGLLTDTPGSRAPRNMDGVAWIGKIAQRPGFSQRHGRPTMGKSGRKADHIFGGPSPQTAEQKHTYGSAPCCVRNRTSQA